MEEETSAKLIAEDGILKGQVIALEEGESWTIGRDPDNCDVVIEDPATSRQHLRVRRQPSGWLIENLSNTNPIVLNDVEVTEQEALNEGDTIRIGSSLFRFYSGKEPTPERAATPPNEEVIPPDTPQPAGAPPEQAESTSEELPSEEAPPPEESKEQGEPPPAVTEEEVFADLDLDLTRQGRWMLKVISGPNNGAEFTMDSGQSYVVGNDAASCDLVFHDISVSRKHARLSVSDSDVLTVEDLQSRNGTQVDGESIEERTTLEGNQLVTLGTSTFVVIDCEGERDTIVSPPLASLGKVLAHPDAVAATQAAVQGEVGGEGEAEEKEAPPPPEPKKTPITSWMVLGLLAGLLLVLGWGVLSLFHTEEVLQEKFDHEAGLTSALQQFPHVQHSYSPSTGTLLLIGHVSTPVDRSQLMYNLQGLPYVKKVDENIVIDELVWQEANQVLAKNPKWRSVNIQAPSPGRYVLSGYLRNSADAEQLADYISLNFSYPERLENHVVVEEDVINQVLSRLREVRIVEVSPEISNGELTLTGVVGYDQVDEFQDLLSEFRDITGVRNIRNFVSEVEPQAALIDLSNDYEVTGFSDRAGVNVSVVVNGKILAVGDRLDGMRIIEIRDGNIILERDGFKFKISFKK